MSTGAAAVTIDGKDPPLFESPLKGIKRDYGMRLPLFLSDITDGLNTQCLAATCFLFFACLAPAVGFGALFGAATKGVSDGVERLTYVSGANLNHLYCCIYRQSVQLKWSALQLCAE